MNAPERDSTEDLIGRALRTEGGHLSIGRGGFSLQFGSGYTLSGYDWESIKATCVARGLPVIDSRDVPFDVAFRLAVRGPMIAVGQPADAPPWGSLSNAPLRVVAAAYRRAGADVVNLPADDL